MDSKFENNETYEEMASRFQVYLLHWLNDALLKNGVNDADSRKRIIIDFAYPFSIWLDQYWFEGLPNLKVSPCISFSENGPASQLGYDELGKVIFPSEFFSFKEYLNGNLYHYFEELGEDITKIESGLHGD